MARKEKYIGNHGYVLVYKPEHFKASSRGYVYEHILVLEESLGRPIEPGEHAHHIDGDKTNNKIGNLMLFKTKAMHTAYHARLKAFEECGHYDWRMCGLCHKYDDPANLQFSNGVGNCTHKECKAIYWQNNKHKYGYNGENNPKLSEVKFALRNSTTEDFEL